MSLFAIQCRAARGLLNFSQLDVANLAHVSDGTVSQFEQHEKEPSYNNLQAIRAALEAAGVAFIPANSGGPGVRLREARSGDVAGKVEFSPDLCRAARYLLDLSQQDVADAAGIARSTVAEFERGARQSRSGNLAAMRTALETAGVVFIAPNGGGPGVRLRER